MSCSCLVRIFCSSIFWSCIKVELYIHCPCLEQTCSDWASCSLFGTVSNKLESLQIDFSLYSLQKLVDVISTHWCWVLWFLQAIAIVLGFLVFVALIILLVFAVKTRSKIRHWGPERVLWEEVKVISEGPHNSIGEWVSSCVCCCCFYGKNLSVVFVLVFLIEFNCILYTFFF